MSDRSCRKLYCLVVAYYVHQSLMYTMAIAESYIARLLHIMRTNP